MSRKLVTFFSPTGTTAHAAQKLASFTDADLFEIEPEVEFSLADLNWKNPVSRSSLESEDPSSRPSLKKKDLDLESYDVIFVGFPIWWYTAPRLIETFLEETNLSGKTVIPFATSGGTGMEKAQELFESRLQNADVRKGRLLNHHLGPKHLEEWMEEIEIR